MPGTCWAAIEEAFAGEQGVLNVAEVTKRINARHPNQPWNPPAIRKCLRGLSVNHKGGDYPNSLRQHAFLVRVGQGLFRRRDHARDEADETSADGSEWVDANEADGAPTADLESAAIDTSLSLERDLENSLINDLAQIEPQLQLFQDQGISGRQVDAGAVGRIDILATDGDGSLVVIELKAGRADDRACGQILRYMGWVKEHLAGDRMVRGIIVANDFSDAMKYAAKAMAGVILQKYEIRFRFSPV